MSIIRFIGDVHGKFGRYKTILQDSPYPTIQVGDIGIGFRKWPHGEWTANPPYDLMVEKDARFIRGNHDNPEVCEKHTQWIADGNIESGVMFIGGALSIDRAYRTKDYSWWSDEELSQEKLDDMVELFTEAKPKMIVTHECPEEIAIMIVSAMPHIGRNGPIKLDPRFDSRTRHALQDMFAAHQPKLWIFGHWHVPIDKVVNGTRFICLPELAFMDVETETATTIWDVVPQREKW